MSRLFEWNPVTLKRWRRFRRLHRAWYSFCILLALYGLSLLAEFICNNEPLYVRFEGRSYFPVLFFYPEAEFLKDGKLTRPDYKRIAATPSFTGSPGHRMVFAPIPFGPNESIDPASLAASQRITLVFRPRLRVATVDLRPDLTIARAAGAEPFFDMTTALTDVVMTNVWRLPAELSAAMAQRFRNEAAPATAFTLTRATGSGHRIEGRFSEFIPRASPPATIRMTLRELAPTPSEGFVLPADLAGRSARPEHAFWYRLNPACQSNLMSLARRRIQEPVERQAITLDGAPYDVDVTKAEVHWPYPPTRGHWLGIDNAGRDVLARLLYGLRTSMTFGFLLVGLSIALGTLFGAVQGYFGGKVDLTGQRLTEIWSALPFLYIMILLGAVYGRGFMLLALCYAAFNWIGISYYIRGEFLRLRRLPFVEAARALGLPHRKIMVRHILPNALVPIITLFPFYLVGAIGALAALDYLGFGLPPPTASWGELLQQAQQFRWAWWLILYPSLALFGVMLLTVFVGEGVRNAYDPRPRTRME